MVLSRHDDGVIVYVCVCMCVRVCACACACACMDVSWRFIGFEVPHPHLSGFAALSVCSEVTAELLVSSWSWRLTEATDSGAKEDKLSLEGNFKRSTKHRALY